MVVGSPVASTPYLEVMCTYKCFGAWFVIADSLFWTLRLIRKLRGRDFLSGGAYLQGTSEAAVPRRVRSAPQAFCLPSTWWCFDEKCFSHVAMKASVKMNHHPPPARHPQVESGDKPLREAGAWGAPCAHAHGPVPHAPGDTSVPVRYRSEHIVCV